MVSRRVSFSYFSKVAFDHKRWSLILFRNFMDHVTIFCTNPMQHLRWSSKSR